MRLRLVSVEFLSLLLFGYLGCRTDETQLRTTSLEQPLQSTGAGKAQATEGVALNTQGIPSPLPPGALIDATMESKVGVLLDELPESMRERIAQSFIQQGDDFWVKRAKAQAKLTTYKLVFRKSFYDKKKQQLPLPPQEVQEITLLGKPKREKTKNHDTVVLSYRLHTVIVTDQESPGVSEPNLAKIGGVWKEPFNLPVDPELVVSRTGSACMDEAEFPPGSLDSEDAAIYFDGECQVEKEPSRTGCHLTTPLPKKSCKQALLDKVGLAKTEVVFKRLPWDEAIAAKYTVAPLESTGGANLKELEEGVKENRVVYKYITKDSCEIEERCVGGTGWRRLMRFAAVEQNVGDKPVDVGAIDYYLTGNGPTINEVNHIFEFSKCHQHYHFSHFVNYGFEGVDNNTTKRGFCLESTLRRSNDQRSPLHNPYDTCAYQGIEIGWADQYNGGIPCQWVDTTDIDTKEGAVSHTLQTQANPDGFLCEGSPVLDAAGQAVYEPTQFKTAAGETVNRAKCQFIPGWDANNEHELQVKVPAWGDGLITEPCLRGQIGPLRNCGLVNAKKTLSCQPGQKTKVRCQSANESAPQVARLCPYSTKGKSAIACLHEESFGSFNVEKSAEWNFTCPTALGEDEPGGEVALYSGAQVPGEPIAGISCEID